MNDPRVGQRTPAGVQYPARTLSGRAVEFPPTTRSLGDGFFVVLDRHPSVNVEAEIETLRAALFAPPVNVEAADVEPLEEGEALEPETDRP